MIKTLSPISGPKSPSIDYCATITTTETPAPVYGNFDSCARQISSN